MTTVVSSTLLICGTPEAPPGFVGDVRFSLWSSGEERVASSSILLGYTKPALIDAPAVSLARSSGGTAVVIYGTNFVEALNSFANLVPRSLLLQSGTPYPKLNAPHLRMPLEWFP